MDTYRPVRATGKGGKRGCPCAAGRGRPDGGGRRGGGEASGLGPGGRLPLPVLARTLLFRQPAPPKKTHLARPPWPGRACRHPGQVSGRGRGAGVGVEAGVRPGRGRGREKKKGEERKMQPRRRAAASGFCLLMPGAAAPGTCTGASQARAGLWMTSSLMGGSGRAGIAESGAGWGWRPRGLMPCAASPPDLSPPSDAPPLPLSFPSLLSPLAGPPVQAWPWQSRRPGGEPPFYSVCVCVCCADGRVCVLGSVRAEKGGE